MADEQTYSMDELSVLCGISIRNIRYYMQLEMVNRPLGNRRNAYYTAQHLEQLLTIRKWQEAGLSLERIKKVLSKEETDIPVVARPPGSITITSNIHLAKGVDLLIDASLCEYTSAEIRQIAQAVIAALPKTNDNQSREN